MNLGIRRPVVFDRNIQVASTFAATDLTHASSLVVPVSGFQVGDLCVVATVWYDSFNAKVIQTPVDNGPNSYTLRGQTTWVNPSYFANIGVGDAVIVTPPTTITVSLDFSTVDTIMSAIVLRIVGGAKFYYSSSFQQQTGSNPATGPIVTQPQSIVVAGLTHGAGDTTLDPETGWIVGPENESTAGLVPYASAYKVFTAAQAALTETWATSGSINASTFLASYRAS